MIAATELTRHFLVKCRPCSRVFSIATLPIELTAMSGLMERAHCPRCDADSSTLFVASEEDAIVWAQQQSGSP